MDIRVAVNQGLFGLQRWRRDLLVLSIWRIAALCYRPCYNNRRIDDICITNDLFLVITHSY
jgi:hypothetical protein